MSTTTAERVDQHVVFVNQGEKQALLNHRLKDESIDRALVFTRTKHGADRVVRHLAGAGIKAAAIHGNKSQGQRTAAMQGFRSGHLKVLVATDIAARGIDVPGVSHVFNYELPNVPDQYVHRIGRTARAGADGIAVSFVSDDERGYLKDIERLTKIRLTQIGLPEGFRQMVAEMPKPVVAKREEEPRRHGGRPGGERQGQGRPGARKPRPQRESQLMSRDGYGRDELTVSAPRDDNRAPRADNRPGHKRGGPPISSSAQGRDGERPRNYGPKPAGLGKFKGAVKRAR